MNKKLRIVFMGTPEFAVASLAILLKNGYNIVGVITAPDKPAGRGQKLHLSAVKEFALKHNLKLFQPTNLKDTHFLNDLQLLNAHLQIVVAFRMLPEVVWNMPSLGTYNLHGSLLPKYRGAAPINWSIINGDKESGVTTFKLTHQIDTGHILYQEKVAVDSSTNAGQLHDQLMEIGAELILKTVNTINESFNTNKELNFIIQKDELATHAPKLDKENCKLNWNKSATEVYNLIRGLSPYPAAYTTFTDLEKGIQLIKIFKAEILKTEIKHAAGSLLSDNKTFIHIACADRCIAVHELQLQGKKKMETKEFLNGYKFKQPLILK